MKKITWSLPLTVFLMALWGVGLSCSSADAAPNGNFESDLKTLTATPHRLSGTPEGHAAAEYIKGRLTGMGIKDVYTLEMPLLQTHVERCEITIGDVTAKLLPIRPNIILPPVTPKEGLTGPLRYVGAGEPEDFGGRSVEGAIVVFEYDSFDGWRRAFAMGAKAVIFIGSPTATATVPKHAAIPANLVRLYAPADVLKKIDLRKDHSKATVVSHMRWRSGTGTNVLAFLPGTDKEQRNPEMVVLSAHYDTFGQVPYLSPGARGAANVAALLASVEHFAQHRPRRDLLFAFLDNQARFHQGGRAFYSSIRMSDSIDARLRRERLQETEYLRQTLPLLRADDPKQWEAPAAIRKATLKALTHQTEAVRSDINRQLMRLRMDADETGNEALKKEQAEWNIARRTFSKEKRPAVKVCREQPEIYRKLCLNVVEQLEKRLRELDILVRVDQQRRELRRRCADRSILLHVAYDLSDRGPTWGLVTGESIPKAPPVTDPGADGPGHYRRVLGAFRAAAGTLPDGLGLAVRTLKDPTEGGRFVVGPFVAGGKAAGIYGIYNLALMTGYDARPRDGHPSDTLENLSWKNIRRQARAARKLLAGVLQEKSLSQPPVFSDRSLNKNPRWDNDKFSTTGDFVGLRVTGELLEQRPAAGAVLAMWSSAGTKQNQPAYCPTVVTAPFSFDPIVLEQVDMNGHFPLVGMDNAMFRNYKALAAVFTETGNVNFITSQVTLPARAGASARVMVFPSAGYTVGPPLMSYGLPGVIRTRVLRAAYDAEFREDQSLCGYDDHFTFFHIYRYYNLRSERVKIFHRFGPALLGMGTDEQSGHGYPIEDFSTPPPVDKWSANDLFGINERRLSTLRKHGITDGSLESLHGRAMRLLDEANETGPDDGTIVERQKQLGRSTELSRRVHGPLRTLMNDLVHAIVILLLLAIPFAFAMERLLICATNIYTRLLGFAVIFIITFGLLYWMHPGFAIASTPIIIFLAFVIILLSSLVIFIVVRKFQTELKQMQGQSGRRHNIEMSWLGTLIAAVNMGISTMRRRPIRTILTAVTVVILTFTILCFASMTSHMGVRDIYEGPVGDDVSAGMFLRQLECTEISPDVLTIVSGYEDEEGLIAPQWWLVRREETDTPFSVAEIKTGRALMLDGIMGISPAELGYNPALTDVLAGENLKEKMAALQAGQVYLPRIVTEQLGLKTGDEVLLAGRSMVVAGTFDANGLQKLNHLDGRSILPVDFQDPSSEIKDRRETDISIEVDAGAVAREFVRLSPNQVAIISDDRARRIGGQLYVVNIYPGAQADCLEKGLALAEQVDLPVWVRGPQGVERLIFTRLTELSGGAALVIPVLLGGLIIFGTMLGSVTDRQKEIYSFSALGLAPTDVGFLFFAEAAVYAVVGGVMGQLLAQTVATAGSFLAEHRIIRPFSANFSSTNSMFAMGIVMGTVLASAIYPAIRASQSANPGLQRSWKMPPPEGDLFSMTFPFTVSAYDITGVVSFLAEHFRQHDDAGLGVFAAQDVRINRDEDTGMLTLSTHLALAPFDLGVTQDFTLSTSPSEIPGVDEVSIQALRRSGAGADWKRVNRTFLHDLRKQFLLWRTLSTEAVESYRMQTFELVGGGAQTDDSLVDGNDNDSEVS